MRRKYDGNYEECIFCKGQILKESDAVSLCPKNHIVHKNCESIDRLLRQSRNLSTHKCTFCQNEIKEILDELEVLLQDDDIKEILKNHRPSRSWSRSRSRSRSRSGSPHPERSSSSRRR